MKALSIKQPWASLIVNGIKDIENRDWRTYFRGFVAIHSSAKLDRDEMESACGLMRGFVPRFSAARFQQDKFPLGAIIGVAEIVDCVESSESPWFMGDFGFVIRNAVAFPAPIACKGALLFWEVPESLMPNVRRQYRAAVDAVQPRLAREVPVGWVVQ